MKHLLRSAVDELEPTLPIDDEHAFHHAGENGFHSRAVARQFLDALPQFLHGRIEHARHRAEFVGAVILRRSPQIAFPVTTRHRRDALDPTAEEHREQPGECDGHRRCQPERDQRAGADPPKLLRDGSQPLTAVVIRHLSLGT